MATLTNDALPASVNSLISRLFTELEVLRQELEDARHDRDDLAKQLDELEMQQAEHAFVLGCLERHINAAANVPPHDLDLPPPVDPAVEAVLALIKADPNIALALAGDDA